MGSVQGGGAAGVYGEIGAPLLRGRHHDLDQTHAHEIGTHARRAPAHCRDRPIRFQTALCASNRRISESHTCAVEQFRLVGASEPERFVESAPAPDVSGPRCPRPDQAACRRRRRCHRARRPCDDRTAGHDLVRRQEWPCSPRYVARPSAPLGDTFQLCSGTTTTPRNSASITSPTPCEASLITFSESCPNA